MLGIAASPRLIGQLIDFSAPVISLIEGYGDESFLRSRAAIP
jgi:hypothetical protein